MIETEGLGRNVFNNIDACYYIGRDATPEPEPDAMNGVYALVYGPNKEIIDTGWSPMNAWNGLHSAAIRWFSNLSMDDPGLIVEYWKRDSEGNEVLARDPIELTWDTYNSDEYGDNCGVNLFSENYEYRIIVKSHPSLSENEWVAVDYIRIIILDYHQVMAGYVSGVEDDEGAVAIQVDWPEIYSITGDGTAFVTRTITYPVPLEVLGAFPTMSSRNFGYEVIPFLINEDDFTIRASRYNGANWSGTIEVVCDLKLLLIIKPL